MLRTAKSSGQVFRSAMKYTLVDSYGRPQNPNNPLNGIKSMVFGVFEKLKQGIARKDLSSCHYTWSISTVILQLHTNMQKITQ